MKRTISISEMADYCQVTAETIRRWIDSGAIYANRTLGGHRRINYKDFLSFLEENNFPMERGSVAQSRRILVINSDQKASNALCSSLSDISKNLILEQAGDGFEAGHKLATFNPDYIFLNKKTTGLDSQKACKIIREHPSTRTSTIIGMEKKIDGHAKTSVKNPDFDFLIDDPKDLNILKSILDPH